ncbi:hypothetical protein [Alkalibacillus haloalkaliphilus]|uniref:hypothetical protein n=1 Tax=Alkalibacillus haloalkaliphilus TaxID=94136 RepID=UPI0002DB4F44|nr:hypothetical protein [Alkalibacillus haloalkaliphilus]
MSNKLWTTLSIICAFVGLALWLPNIIFQFGYSFWALTFLVNPIGALFGLIGKSKLGVVLNLIMTFNFFILMFIGYFLLSWL